MKKHISLPPNVEVARYNTDQRIPRYRGNKLIEALPPSQTEDELIESLKFQPAFDRSSREWESHERMHELMSLTNIMVPLASHIQLARVLDSMMREGYVGRRPMSRDHVAIYQDINDHQRNRQPFRQSADTVTAQLSTALIGVSGMGKTTTVKRCLAHINPVIYHPELDLYQITHLHFEMPSDGKGVKALATSIISRIDELVPNANYYHDYVGSGKASGDALLSSAARLANKHCVGLLIPDEVQNMSNTRKDDQIVMTELTSLSNRVKAPQLLIGTNKAHKILGLDFRQARRSLSLGLGNWHALPRSEPGYNERGESALVDGEWVDFMNALWVYQWVKKEVKLSKELLDRFYEYTQGVIDLAIKLFIVSQARAILDGSETLSEQLIDDVYKSDMRLVHPMVEALRENDMVALMKYEDIAPISATDMLSDLERRFRGQRNRAASTRAGSEGFEQRLTSVGQALGLPVEDAASIAREINAEGTAKDMFDAATQLGKKMAAPKRPSKARSKKALAQASLSLDLTARPLDYRNAVALASDGNTLIYDQLLTLGMVPETEDLICLG